MKIPSELILTEEHLDRAIKALAVTHGKDWVKNCVIAQLGIDTIGEVLSSSAQGFSNDGVSVNFKGNPQLQEVMRWFDAHQPENVRPLLPLTIQVSEVKECPPR